jgi:hypothetical protein
MANFKKASSVSALKSLIILTWGRRREGKSRMDQKNSASAQKDPKKAIELVQVDDEEVYISLFFLHTLPRLFPIKK